MVSRKYMACIYTNMENASPSCKLHTRSLLVELRHKHPTMNVCVCVKGCLWWGPPSMPLLICKIETLI